MLGICVIYLCSDESGEFLARKSIEQIKKHTWGEYRIYGHAPRASDSFLEILRQSGVICLPQKEVPPEMIVPIKRGRIEHSFLLNDLVSRAFNDGCDVIATFDMDSWPVMPGWDKFYSEKLSEKTPVAAIIRTELNGGNLPFAGFTILSRPFWKTGHSSFSSSSDSSISSAPDETGSGILNQIAREKKHSCVSKRQMNGFLTLSSLPYMMMPFFILAQDRAQQIPKLAFQ